MSIPDLALCTPVIKMSRDSDFASDTRGFQGIPGIECTSRGRLWATWYGGGNDEGPDNYVMLATSADGGKTWSDVKMVIDPLGEVRAFDPCLWIDPSGRMWLFWAQSLQLWDGRGGVWAITTSNPDDEEPTWTAPTRISDGVMMNKPTVLSTGPWLLPVAQWSRPGTHRHSPTPRGARVLQSLDSGGTWTLHGCAAVPEDVAEFEEHMLIERRDGTLWMLLRTKYGIAQTTSTDGGRFWEPITKSMLEHPSARFFIRRLASGSLLLVKHSPPKQVVQRSHLTAYISHDDGKTWPWSLLLDERVGVSYPDGAENSQGTIYVIHDFERTGAREICVVAFTENDILRSSEGNKPNLLRALVNRPRY